jgi:ATP-binding protein involved in chromosome partitioning
MTTINAEQILDALRVVMDPDLGKDLVSTKSIENIHIDGMVVSLTVNLATNSDKVKQQIQQACESAIRELVHKDIVPVIKIGSRPSAGNTSSQTNENDLLPQVKNIIAVASGKGGVERSGHPLP